jgi:plasmid replication initiation protein
MAKEIKDAIKIRKPSALIAQSTFKVAKNQRKYYNFLLHKAFEIVSKNPNQRIFTIAIKDLKTLSGVGETNYQTIKDDVVSLSKTNVFYNLFNKSKKDYSDWITFNLLSHAKKIDENIEFSIPEPVLQLLQEPDVFAMLDRLIMQDLKKSKYSMILYELFEDYKHVEIPIMSVKELRVLFGIEEKKYPNFYDFEKWTIKPAIAEINEKSGIRMEYKKLPEDTGKTTHIKFIFYSGPDLARKIYEESLVNNLHQIVDLEQASKFL